MPLILQFPLQGHLKYVKAKGRFAALLPASSATIIISL